MTRSFKDMVQSVDWGKVFSGKDARNAAIGSALGGLMVGGAGLMAERDPEESRLAPVGDALTGALLGGVAGYGIPKGVAMFLDAGSLAPDGDTLRHHYGKSALVGGTLGVGAAGLSIKKTLADVARSLRPSAEQRATAEALSLATLRRAQAARRDPALIDQLNQQYKASLTDEGAVRAYTDSLRKERLNALRRGDAHEASRLGRRLKAFKRMRNRETRGYSSFWDLLGATGRQGGAIRSRSLLERILGVADEAASQGTEASKGILSRLKGFFSSKAKDLASPRHYHNGALFRGYGLKLTSAPSAGLRMLKRTGTWGLGGAAAAMLLHKFLGPDPSSNFKK